MLRMQAAQNGLRAAAGEEARCVRLPAVFRTGVWPQRVLLLARHPWPCVRLIQHSLLSEGDCR